MGRTEEFRQIEIRSKIEHGCPIEDDLSYSPRRHAPESSTGSPGSQPGV
jgi:hypothetical protein